MGGKKTLFLALLHEAMEAPEAEPAAAAEAAPSGKRLLEPPG